MSGFFLFGVLYSEENNVANYQVDQLSGCCFIFIRSEDLIKLVFQSELFSFQSCNLLIKRGSWPVFSPSDRVIQLVVLMKERGKTDVFCFQS